MPVKIRHAEKEDCPRIFDLVRELADYVKEPDSVTLSLEEFTRAGFGTQPVWQAFVAENEAQIVGFALYYIRFSTWKGPQIYLEDLLVTRSFRHQGIGKMLFERLISEAKKKGLKGVTWQVLKANKPALRFYKKYNALLNQELLNASLPSL